MWLAAELSTYDDALNSLASEALTFIEGITTCFVPREYSKPVETALNVFESKVPHLLENLSSLDHLVQNFPSLKAPQERKIAIEHMEVEFDRVITSINATRAELSRVYQTELERMIDPYAFPTPRALDRVQKMHADRFLNAFFFTAKYLAQFIKDLKMYAL